MCWVLLAARRLSLVVVHAYELSRSAVSDSWGCSLPGSLVHGILALRGGYSLALVCGLLIVEASLVAERRLQGSQASVVAACGVGICGSWALEHRLHSCGAQALVAPRHVGSSRTRDQTYVPCIGRLTHPLYHSGSPIMQ